MADTYKTMPVRVKEAKRLIKVVESHNHVDGPCDLYPQPVAEHWTAHQTSWVSTRCHWQYVWEGKNFSCGCAMCTGRIYRKAQTRSLRRAEHVETSSVHPDDVDTGRINTKKLVW